MLLCNLINLVFQNKSNEVNEKLLKAVNADGRIHIVPSEVKKVYFLRFAVCATRTTPDDVIFAWNVIKELASKILADEDLNNAK